MSSDPLGSIGGNDPGLGGCVFMLPFIAMPFLIAYVLIRLLFFDGPAPDPEATATQVIPYTHTPREPTPHRD